VSILKIPAEGDSSQVTKLVMGSFEGWGGAQMAGERPWLPSSVSQEKNKSRDIIALVLKMEEGTISQGMLVASRNWGRQGINTSKWFYFGSHISSSVDH
jgi:hypothetical protein